MCVCLKAKTDIKHDTYVRPVIGGRGRLCRGGSRALKTSTTGIDNHSSILLAAVRAGLQSAHAKLVFCPGVDIPARSLSLAGLLVCIYFPHARHPQRHISLRSVPAPSRPFSNQILCAKIALSCPSLRFTFAALVDTIVLFPRFGRLFAPGSRTKPSHSCGGRGRRGVRTDLLPGCVRRVRGGVRVPGARAAPLLFGGVFGDGTSGE